MFEVGDLIIYGYQGVCRVDAIGKSDISGVPSDKLYYTLIPLYGSGKIMIPVDAKVFMRPVKSKEEVDAIIKQMPDIASEVVESQNYKVMEEHYKKLLATHECTDLVNIMKSVYAKRQIVKLQGKNLGHTDEKYKKIAEDLLYSEFAVALHIEKDSVPGYIENTLHETAAFLS